MKQRFLGFLVWIIYRVLSSTWRVTLIEPDSLKQRFHDQNTTIFAHWHGDELVLLQLLGRYRIGTLTSTSQDGEIMNTAAQLAGAKTTRGSSTRGGASGLRALIKLVKSERLNSSFAVDGPKGPIYKVKPGIFEMSRLLKAPIYPGGVACDRAWHFPKSWNKTFLPKPFAQIVIRWDEPLEALGPEDDPKSPKFSERLEKALHHGRDEAQKNLAAKISE